MSCEKSPLSALVTHLDGSVLVALAGELDIATSPQLRAVVAETVSPHLRHARLDVGGLTFVDVVGLRALVDAQQMVTAAGADFQLLSVNDFTLKVIRLAGFTELAGATESV